MIEFFERDDVSRICPDKKKCMATSDGVKQIRYLTEDLKTLHMRYCAEVEDCDYSTFTRYVPPHIMKPQLSDWGTCLYMQCLNPSLKHERLVKLGYMKSGRSLQQMFEDDGLMMDFQQEMEQLREEKTVVRFVEWRRVENKDSSKGTKISRKEIVMWPVNEMIKSLENEVKNMKDHLKRAHVQYSAFKKERLNAQEDENKLVVQIDWSENLKLRQAQEEKSAYYHEQQISIHAMYCWTYEGNESVAVLSDCTDHRAAAVWASLKPILQRGIANGQSNIVIVSDSPTSQYRNKDIFYLNNAFATEHDLSLRWIYLESGHGKGIADGVGAAVKRVITTIMAQNVNEPIYTVNNHKHSHLHVRNVIKI